MKFIQHIPGFVSGFEPSIYEADTVADLLSKPNIAQWNDDRLVRFSVCDDVRDAKDTLMAEMKDGKWWVVGFVEPKGSLDALPRWEKSK